MAQSLDINMANSKATSVGDKVTVTQFSQLCQLFVGVSENQVLKLSDPVITFKMPIIIIVVVAVAVMIVKYIFLKIHFLYRAIMRISDEWINHLAHAMDLLCNSCHQKSI